MDLKGRVAVVTGASRGVGRAIAAALEARGLVAQQSRATRHVSRPMSRIRPMSLANAVTS